MCVGLLFGIWEILWFVFIRVKGVNFLGMVLEGGMGGEEVRDRVTFGGNVLFYWYWFWK